MNTRLHEHHINQLMCLAYTVKCMHPPPTGGLCDFTVLCGVPKWGSGKESACRCRRLRFNPWVRKSPWCRKWQPIPEFLPGKFHGQRSLEGYSPWGRTESDTTEWLSSSSSTVQIKAHSLMVARLTLRGALIPNSVKNGWLGFFYRLLGNFNFRVELLKPSCRIVMSIWWDNK